MIDAYIELKMEEVERFEHDAAPGRVRHVLLGLSRPHTKQRAGQETGRLFLFKIDRIVFDN
jgi:hypothetical protein